MPGEGHAEAARALLHELETACLDPCGRPSQRVPTANARARFCIVLSLGALRVSELLLQ